jgi:Immunity protein Imm1
MSRPTKVSWGGGDRDVVNTVEELDALLDRLDAEARRSGFPLDVQLDAGGGSGWLGIVVGHDRSVLNHVPDDANPPYLASSGDEDEDRGFAFRYAGEFSEVHWRHTIPAELAREAARTFLLTGRLDERVNWDET